MPEKRPLLGLIARTRRAKNWPGSALLEARDGVTPAARRGLQRIG
jgi:hypothetical protein